MEYNTGSSYGYDEINARMDPTALFSSRMLDSGRTFLASSDEYPKMKKYDSLWDPSDLIKKPADPRKLSAPPGMVEGYNGIQNADRSSAGSLADRSSAERSSAGIYNMGNVTVSIECLLLIMFIVMIFIGVVQIKILSQLEMLMQNSGYSRNGNIANNTPNS